MNDIQTSALNLALAANLARVMSTRSISQYALAKKSGIAQSTISLYLNPDARQSKRRPRSAKLAEIEILAAALDVSPLDLLQPETEWIINENRKVD